MLPGEARNRWQQSSTVAPCARRRRAVHGPDTTAASASDDRAEVGKLADAVQQATGETVELIYVDQGYTGEKPAKAARAQGVELCVVKLSEAKKAFVLLPKRWVVNHRTI